MTQIRFKFRFRKHKVFPLCPNYFLLLWNFHSDTLLDCPWNGYELVYGICFKNRTLQKGTTESIQFADIDRIAIKSYVSKIWIVVLGLASNKSITLGIQQIRLKATHRANSFVR